MWGLNGKLFRKAWTGATAKESDPAAQSGPTAQSDAAAQTDPVTTRGADLAAPMEADPVRQYTEEVCSQIRYQRARPYIEKELADHIEDRKRSLVKEGVHEAEALGRAVSDMGDAVTVGQELDRVHRPKPEWSIIVIIAATLCIGAFSQYYLSVQTAAEGWPAQSVFSKYLTALPWGIAVLLVIYFADYTILGKYPKQIYAGILLSCAAFYLYDGQFFSFYGHNLNARYQMVYLALLLLPSYGAVLYGYRNSGYGGILKCGAAAVLAILIFGYSQAYVPAIFALGGLLLLSAAIAKGWFAVEKKKAFALVYVSTLLSLLGFFLIKLWGYGEEKDVFLRGIKGIIFLRDTTGEYLTLHARSIVNNAQFIGQGELGSMVKPGTRPEEFISSWWADFSLTYLIYHWGLIVAAVFLAIFALLLVRMLRAVLKQKNALGFMVSLSALVAIGMQCMLFFTANLGIRVFVILPLPLMTMGQTSFIVNMVLLGLLLSAYRNIDIVRDMPAEDQRTGKKSSY